MTVVRIALGLALGALLAALPWAHYRYGGGHVHEPPGATTGGPHASHTH